MANARPAGVQELTCRSACSLPGCRSTRPRDADSLEPRHQVELPEPAAARAIERADVVDLGDREAEHVDAQRARRRWPPARLSLPPKQRAVVLAPGHAARRRRPPSRSAADRRSCSPPNAPHSGNRSSALAIATRLPISRSNAGHDPSVVHAALARLERVRSRSRAPGPDSRDRAPAAAGPPRRCRSGRSTARGTRT